MLKNYEVNSVSGYIITIINLGPGIYRGQREDWPLLPSLIRPYMQRALYRNPYLEKNLLERFRLNVAGYLPGLEDINIRRWWRCLILAQHHCLPTRLLDWTTSPLAALFFASEELPSQGKPSIVYRLSMPEVFTIDYFVRKFECSPWNYKNDRLLFLQPELTHPRIAAQGSIFSVHPGVPVDKIGPEIYQARLTKIEIPKDPIPKVTTELYRLGVTRSSLFREPDAVSKTLVWEVRGEVDRLSDKVLRGRNKQRSAFLNEKKADHKDKN